MPKPFFILFFLFFCFVILIRQKRVCEQYAKIYDTREALEVMILMFFYLLIDPNEDREDERKKSQARTGLL